MFKHVLFIQTFGNKRVHLDLSIITQTQMENTSIIKELQQDGGFINTKGF